LTGVNLRAYVLQLLLQVFDQDLGKIIMLNKMTQTSDKGIAVGCKTTGSLLLVALALLA